MTHTFKLSRRTARLRAASLVAVVALAGACADSTAPTPVESGYAPSFATTSTSLSISNISVRTGTTYQVGSGLSTGARQYVDRSYTYATVPSIVQGLTYIRTANDDKNAYVGVNSFLTFNVNVDAVVYVAHDDRVSRPSWLTANFQNTGYDLLSSDGESRYSIFKRSVPAGQVTLGSNSSSTTAGSMYLVMVEPASSGSALVTSTSSGSTSGAGIPFGLFNMPNSDFGSVYNGALRNIWAQYLLSNLSTIKSHGGKVMLVLAGGRSTYTNSDGTFSFTKWKANVDKFRTVNFSSYLKDGTIIGHYLTDEPNCAACWGGKAIPPSTIEAMAQYSKSIWSNMLTVVRTYPDYLNTWSGTYTYLDAAWAQYVYRKGDVSTFIADNVASAKKKGLALVVGLNVLKGGVNDGPMTASQVQSWGTTLLNNSYACAFLNWDYNNTYLTSSGIKSAMAYLRSKADAHPIQSCWHS